MVNLKDKELNKKLRKLEKEELPTIKDIKKENELLKSREERFNKKFLRKSKKHK